jgi:NAD(P)H-hydrate epimerase
MSTALGTGADNRAGILLSAEQMAELDRRCIEDCGVPGLLLMECAAQACVDALFEEFGDRLARGVAVLCGPGNNGADGVAIARRLHVLGVPVEAVLLGRRAMAQGDAATQVQILQALGGTLREAPSSEPLGFATRRLSEMGVVVDAILGTGLGRPVAGLFAEAVAAIRGARAAGVPVLAVDIPSGVSGSTGQALGEALEADVTVTFGAAKIGHFQEPGRSRRGRLRIADIGVPVERWTDVLQSAARLLGPADLLAAAPPATVAAHKGNLGHLLVVAGGPGKSGAAVLCAEAALRAGAGLVTLAVPRAALAEVAARLRAEVMTAPLPSTRDGALGQDAAGAVLELLAGRDALALGPGLGTSEETVHAVRRLYAQAAVPAVIDADGLNCLALGGTPAGEAASFRVLTPHPGEMRRLLSMPRDDLAGARLPAAEELARRTGTVVVLKGAGTVIAGGGARTAVNPSGNPGMASAGSGDVLTGVVGALLARGTPAPLAACGAVYWHGLAGDLAAESLGEPALVAGDISAALGRAWLQARRGKVPAPFLLRPARGGRGTA